MRGGERMVQVLLVEDSRLSREAIEARLARSGRYRGWAAMENAANAEIACMGGRVELVLMDVCTADDESGLKAAARIKKWNRRHDSRWTEIRCAGRSISISW